MFVVACRLSSCSKWRLLFSCRALALIAATSLVAQHRLSGARASVAVACGLWSARSVVAVHRLRCSEARGIFLDQGSNSRPLH